MTRFFIAVLAIFTGGASKAQASVSAEPMNQQLYDLQQQLDEQARAEQEYIDLLKGQDNVDILLIDPSVKNQGELAVGSWTETGK